MNHDRLIESGRDRLQKRLNERRMAAMAKKESTERTRAQVILSREDEVEHKWVEYGACSYSFGKLHSYFK